MSNAWLTMDSPVSSNSPMMISPSSISTFSTRTGSSDSGVPVGAETPERTIPDEATVAHTRSHSIRVMGDQRSLESYQSKENKSNASSRHTRSAFIQARQDWDLDISSASSASAYVRSEQREHSVPLNIHGESSLDTQSILQPAEWEANAVIGEKTIKGKKYYIVAWKPTLEPEEELGNMQDLVDEWRQNLANAKRSPGISKGETDGFRDRGQSDQSEVQTKRRRGRPRKDSVTSGHKQKRQSCVHVGPGESQKDEPL